MERSRIDCCGLSGDIIPVITAQIIDAYAGLDVAVSDIPANRIAELAPGDFFLSLIHI